MKRELTKGDVYVVVDTPKKAKKLKKLLEMFKEPIFNPPNHTWSSHNGSEYGWAYGFSDGQWQGFNTKSSIHNGKEFKKVSIKELRNILAKEHLKSGDWIIAKCSYSDCDYLVKVDEIRDNIIMGCFSFMSNNKWTKLSDCSGAFIEFKRYATPEEISLLESKQKELEVGKWYQFIGHEAEHKPLMLITSIIGSIAKFYGFNFLGDWVDNDHYTLEDLKKYGYREATAEEVKSALIKESKKRYKNGDEVKSLYSDSYVGNLNFKYVKYYHDDNDLWISSEYYNIQVFVNGKWAEIIKPKEKINDSDIAIIEALHDVLLDNHKYDFNSKLLTNARELCKKLHNIVGG